MMNRLPLCFGAALSAMLLSAMLLCGCGSDSAGPAATATDQGGQVTFLVEGMTERLSIY